MTEKTFFIKLLLLLSLNCCDPRYKKLEDLTECEWLTHIYFDIRSELSPEQIEKLDPWIRDIYEKDKAEEEEIDKKIKECEEKEGDE